MTMTSQGKAFEYALAQQLSKVTSAPLIDTSRAASIAEEFYRGRVVNRDSMDEAASEAALFLRAYDPRFDEAESIHIQSDKHGQYGDVRDVIVRIFGGEIGLSAKNHHQAIKHSRLSGTIDFGDRWAGYPVSSRYWNRVKPTFDVMESMRNEGLHFRDVPNKNAMFYLPILTAFEDEFTRLCQSHGDKFIKSVFQYLVGQYDFYKVVRQRDHVSIQSYNINGTLMWGRRWTIPNRIDQIHRKQGSDNTLIVAFSGGWQMSFRIHSARSKIEPSLKFDIQFLAMPVSVGNHQIPLGRTV